MPIVKIERRHWNANVEYANYLFENAMGVMPIRMFAQLKGMLIDVNK